MLASPCFDDWIEKQEILSSFRKLLIIWGEDHFRSFPWRLTNNPYAILMAEVMLHRTQAIQVLPVFQAFMTRFPTVQHLALASKYELKSVLSSLGLHWRIELIYEMAQKISGSIETQLPLEKTFLLSLPGVSEYIANAVRCFSWNLPEPLIDTNTTRIIGRIFGLQTIDSSRRNTRFRKLIGILVDPDHPRKYNYALLDLAHMVCLKKQDPLCQKCPILSFCCFGQTK